MKLNENQYFIIRNMVVNQNELTRILNGKVEYEDLIINIERVVKNSQIDVDEEDKHKLLTDMEYEFKTTHSPGGIIYGDYNEPHDWYSNNKPKENLYWQKYRSYLTQKTSLNIKSINLLDEETLPNIMNCLGNPNESYEGKRLKRGLIIGDVQSGKTATYIGLICKAADAGYKVFILLAGITEDLRRQTQSRVDEGFVGYSIKKNGRKETRGRVGVGCDNQSLTVTSYTSCVNDFVGNSDKIASSLKSHNSAVIFIIKKNVSVLKKIYEWLKEHNLDSVKNYIDAPMLMIDDEADNASVNTNSEEIDPTKTNVLIRNICNMFKNATYTGFTATPFANVFIDPESYDSMQQADLFPEHFIYALPTPSNYIGAEKIFCEDGPYHKNLRYITDIDEPDYTSENYRYLLKNDIETLNNGPFYYGHKKEWHGIIPESLKEAVLCFFIANILRDLRGQRSSPRSMLVNMSRFIKVQQYIAEKIEEIYDYFFNIIRYDFSDIVDHNKSLPLGKEFRRLWDKHFAINQPDIEFERIVNKENIIQAIDSIKIIVVNGSKSSEKLDYTLNPGLRVIAVGGLALSRGLTLEGLTISYFYRNTATFDVLMQMGRWFGYRPNYEDIFQIWTSETSAAWYAEISKASQELKDDITQMYEQKLTPKGFGIKVQDKRKDLRITASNKMRSSSSYVMQYSFYGKIYDTPYISINTKQNTSNLDQVEQFTQYLFSKGFKFRFADYSKRDDPNVFSGPGVSRYFEDVPIVDIIDFLGKINCSLVNVNFNIDNILNFLQSPDTVGMDYWNVVFEGGESSKYYPIKGLQMIKCSQRAIYSDSRRVIQVSSRRRILGLREGKFSITKEEIDIAEKSCREAWVNEDHIDPAIAEKRDIPLNAYFQYLPHRNPVLIIMLIEPKVDEVTSTDEKKNYTKIFREELDGDPIVAFAAGFPGTKAAEKGKKYRVNKVFQDLYLTDEGEEEINTED